jgi:hypothetical protein
VYWRVHPRDFLGVFFGVFLGVFLVLDLAIFILYWVEQYLEKKTLEKNVSGAPNMVPGRAARVLETSHA